MELRTKIVGLLFGALLCATVSCGFDGPSGMSPPNDGPIAGITPDVDGPDQVIKVLGVPTTRASGWWRDDSQFDIEFRVWYYKGIGRVIFRPEMDTVYATEADKSQTGLPN
jgi:hypothetical protein